MITLTTQEASLLLGLLDDHLNMPISAAEEKITIAIRKKIRESDKDARIPL